MYLKVMVVIELKLLFELPSNVFLLWLCKAGRLLKYC